MNFQDEYFTSRNSIAAVEYDVLADFEGELSLALFYRTCNLSCPYCHNKELLDISPEEAIDFDKALMKASPMVTGIVFSGGEPTNTIDLHHDIMYAKSKGYKTKLFTNGTNMLAVKACAPYLDAISIDLKYSEESKAIGKYPSDLYKKEVSSTIVLASKIIKDVEVRTTLWLEFSDEELHRIKKSHDILRERYGVKTILQKQR